MLADKVDVPLEEKKLMACSKYTKELGTAVEDNVNPETMIYLLKNQLVETGIINHNLRRVISMLIWKLSMEKTTTNVKAEIGSALQKSVDALEGLLKESSERDETWKRRVEKLDFDISQLKLQLGTTKKTPHGLSGSVLFLRPRIKKAVNRKVSRRPEADGSVRHLKHNEFLQAAREPKRLLSNQALELSKFGDALRAARCGPDADERPQVVEVNETDLAPFEGWNSHKNADANGSISKGSKGMQQPEPGRDSNEFAELENALKEAQIEQRWHKTLSDLLMEELLKCREQIKMLKEQVEKTEESAEKAIKDEAQNWSAVTTNLKVRLSGMNGW